MRSRHRLLIVGCIALAVAVTDLFARPLVRQAGAALLGPVLLLAAVFCLVLIQRQARQHRRRVDAAAAAGQANAGQVTAGQAVGGPCDGQQLALPAGLPVPAEFWLAAQGAAREDPLHRYLLERPPADPPRYLHDPPVGPAQRAGTACDRQSQRCGCSGPGSPPDGVTVVGSWPCLTRRRAGRP